MIEVWSWESKQRRVVSLGLTSTNFPCTMPFFFTCYLGMVCQSSFGNDRSKRAERLSAWVTSNLLMHPSDHWHGFLDFMWAWNKNKLLCYAAVMGFIYYNIHCFFNHYNSLGYSNFDLDPLPLFCRLVSSCWFLDLICKYCVFFVLIKSICMLIQIPAAGPWYWDTS